MSVEQDAHWYAQRELRNRFGFNYSANRERFKTYESVIEAAYVGGYEARAKDQVQQ